MDRAPLPKVQDLSFSLFLFLPTVKKKESKKKPKNFGA